MNLKLLCEAWRWGRDNPENFDMSTWLTRARGSASSIATVGACGTTGCLAGAIVHLRGWKMRFIDFNDRATSLVVNDARESDHVSNVAWRLLDVTLPDPADEDAWEEWCDGPYRSLFYLSNLEAVREHIIKNWDVDPEVYGLEDAA